MLVSRNARTLVHMRHRGQAYERGRRQLGVLILVLSAHALVVIVFWSSGRLDRRRALLPIEPPTTLVQLDLESPVEQPRLEQTTKGHSIAGNHPSRANRAQGTSAAVESKHNGEASENTAITPDEGPRIDWHSELDAAVEDVTPEMLREYVRLCAEAERPHVKHQGGCPRSPYEGPWRPQGKYITLEELRDPDRPRGGVPDPLRPAFPKAPLLSIRIRPPDP
jgi:hypothetical protein